MPEDDTIGRIIQRDLDRLPVLPADRWIPRTPVRRGPPRLARLTSVAAVVLGLVVALGIGQSVRDLRERSAATQSPGAVSSAGASALVPPYLASPDAIVAVSESSRGRPQGAPSDATLRVIDSQTGAIRYSVPVDAGAQAVFRAAGSELIVIDWPRAQGLRIDDIATEQRIRFIDARTGTITATLTEPRPRPFLGQWPALGAAVSPDGKLLALQQLGTLGQSPAQAGQADVVTFYNLETRSRTADSVLLTPGCGPGQLGFTDDGRNLFLACSGSPEVVIADSVTHKQIALGVVFPRRTGTAPGFAGMVVVGNSATVISASGQERYEIRVDGTVNTLNLGQMFADAIVPPGAIVRVPRQARVFVGYGPATPGTFVNDARIMDEGSSGGRFSITRTSSGGILADDRGDMFGADTDGSIWRRGPTTVSDDVTLVPGTPGRSVRLLAVLRVNPPTLLSREQAIKNVNAPNIRIDRVDRVEAKLVTLGEAMSAMQAQAGSLNGFDPATPVWAIALRGEMHAIRGLVDVGPGSALFVLDAQTGQSVIWYSSPLAWPAGFDSLLDRAAPTTPPATASPAPSSTPVSAGSASPSAATCAAVEVGEISVCPGSGAVGTRVRIDARNCADPGAEVHLGLVGNSGETDGTVGSFSLPPATPDALGRVVIEFTVPAVLADVHGEGGGPTRPGTYRIISKPLYCGAAFRVT